LKILENKTAVITGGSGGIGKVVSRALLQEGAKIVIADCCKIRLESVLAELGSISRILAVTVDVADANQVRNLITETHRKFGDIDILVNAAGIQQPIGSFIEADLDAWIKNINVNLIGTVSCCKAVLSDMIKRKQGKIINFSGGGATSPRPNFSAYACAKTAIVRFTETLALEVAPYGIDVNTIAPGAVATSMIKEIMKAGVKAGAKELEIANKIMQKGGTDPYLPAKLIVFLASDKSNGLTGRLISAVWDDWNAFDGRIKQIVDSSLYTLRRIDDRNFTEVAAK
jgi:NAD(P)-dependent dehydrogenase (short-subunit alcohol dehydrogenase family)